jgi:hypothetical protein
MLGVFVTIWHGRSLGGNGDRRGSEPMTPFCLGGVPGGGREKGGRHKYKFSSPNRIKPLKTDSYTYFNSLFNDIIIVYHQAKNNPCAGVQFSSLTSFLSVVRVGSYLNQRVPIILYRILHDLESLCWEHKHRK